MDQVELRVPSDPAYVGLTRLLVSAGARQAGMAGAKVEDLKIAVSEAATNAVRAHQQHASDEPVRILFRINAGLFEVVVADAGPGFDPQPPTTLRDWRSESGLGVTLMRHLADDVTFSRTNGMRVTLCFDLKRSSSNGVVE